jgi:hypothetical protein
MPSANLSQSPKATPASASDGNEALISEIERAWARVFPAAAPVCCPAATVDRQPLERLAAEPSSDSKGRRVCSRGLLVLTMERIHAIPEHGSHSLPASHAGAPSRQRLENMSDLSTLQQLPETSREACLDASPTHAGRHISAVSTTGAPAGRRRNECGRSASHLPHGRGVDPRGGRIRSRLCTTSRSRSMRISPAGKIEILCEELAREARVFHEVFLQELPAVWRASQFPATILRNP